MKSALLWLSVILLLMLAACSDPVPPPPEYVRKTNQSVVIMMDEFYNLDTSHFRLMNIGLYRLSYDSTFESRNLLDTIAAMEIRLRNRPRQEFDSTKVIIDLLFDQDSFMLRTMRTVYHNQKADFREPEFYAAGYEFKESPKYRVFLVDTTTFEVRYVKECPDCPYNPFH